MTSSSVLLKSDSLNFKVGTVIHPTYQYTKQYPQESLGTYSVQATQGPTTTFQLIPNVMNLSKCFLVFTLQVPAQGGGNYTWMNVNGLKQISRITVQPQGGPILMDVNDVDHYLDIIARKTITFPEVQASDAAVPYTVAGTPNGTIFEGLNPNVAAAGAFATRLDNTSANRAQESQYMLATAAANSVMLVDFKISFSKFVDTVLAVDHDLYWKGENLTVTFYWNNLSDYVWLGTSGTNPTTGAAAAVGPASINNPYMLVAIQKNPEITKSIMEKCTSSDGLTIKIPFTYQFNNTIPAGGNNLQVYYNSGQGSHVKKIWWCPYPTTPATPNLVYDKSDLASAKITQFQTQINGINIQQFPFIPTAGDDFLFLRESLRHSDILSLNEHLYNWSWCEDFTEWKTSKIKELWPEVPDDNLIDGLPLIGNVQYNIISTSVANLNNYLFTVFLREVRISGANITLI